MARTRSLRNMVAAGLVAVALLVTGRVAEAAPAFNWTRMGSGLYNFICAWADFFGEYGNLKA